VRFGRRPYEGRRRESPASPPTSPGRVPGVYITVHVLASAVRRRRDGARLRPEPVVALWGGRIVEFFALGTAIVRDSSAATLPSPTPVLDLNDQPNAARLAARARHRLDDERSSFA